jgi:hypothetical protein
MRVFVVGNLEVVCVSGCDMKSTPYMHPLTWWALGTHTNMMAYAHMLLTGSDAGKDPL